MTALLDVVEAIKGSPLVSADIDAIERAMLSSGFGPLPFACVAPGVFAATKRHLEGEEGRVRYAYRDHLGYLTIGVGRLIDARRNGRLLDAEVDLLLANDIAACINAVQYWPAWIRIQTDPIRATALLSMCFQIGVSGLARFTTALTKIAAGEFDAGADAMLDSLWAAQTPARAMRVAYMMRTGALP